MKYFWATIRHKWYVLLASFKVDLPLWRALIHDLSKFSWAELHHYDRQFFGVCGDTLKNRLWLQGSRNITTNGGQG